MKKIFMLIMGWVFLSTLSFAQNEIDALRYSQFNFGGTARFSSMSGAFGALGGDFSVLSTNPAGIAIYRRSEFAFTPGFFSKKTTSNLKGNMLDDYKYNVNFSNAGIVLAYYEPETKNAWKGIMFGFGYNRLNNFNSRISMTGKNDSTSLLDIYVSDAINVGGDANAMDPFGTQLALNSNAIFGDTLGNYWHHIQGSYGKEQSKQVTSSGSMGETVFTLGGNYDDKLYMGMTIGIPNIRYNEESNYQETADTNALNGFKSFELNQDLKTTGVGFNLKFGMIYKPADWVRVGGAFHSPTYFNMRDDWSSSMTTHFTNPNEDFSSESPTGLFDYSLVTPLRAIGSIGFVIKKIGLVGVDYEFVDYPSASLSADKYKYLNENKAIRAKYMEGNNIRFGTEWKLAPMSIRAGAAYYSSPFKNGTGNDNSYRMDYSAGIGFREENFFLDFAYVLSQTTDNYYFYDASIVSPSVNTSKSSNVLMTLGFKF